jgi:hypothetical protein
LKTSSCLTDTYDTQIRCLFRRMSNLEELTFNITVENRREFIDGTHIYNEILVHMPRLQTFNFWICTKMKIDHLDFDLQLCKRDIQQTLTNNIKYQQMDCIVNYRNHSASCYVFSLPFICEELRSIDNTFPNIIFNHVRRLSVKDDFPFEHEFFHRIASSFPLLKELCVNNITQQSLTILNNDNSNGDQFLVYFVLKLFIFITSNNFSIRQKHIYHF